VAAAVARVGIIAPRLQLFQAARAADHCNLQLVAVALLVQMAQHQQPGRRGLRVI
jgi:hypothetical protein